MEGPILVIGGAGYIGSHVCKALATSGAVPIVYDNLSSGHQWAIKWGPFFEGDILDTEQLEKAILTYKPRAVIHLASYIDVRESKKDPFKYYENNLVGTLALLQVLCKHKIKKLIFSSSAAVYGKPLYTPIDEAHPKNPINPYGKIKWAIENLLEDFYHSYGLSSVSLRYFNAAGADSEGEIGEAHTPETHLIPRILLTARQKQHELLIFGVDFPTQDGTAVRDFVHVTDLADAHVKALDYLDHNTEPLALNLGTGKGFSIFEMIATASQITGTKIPYKIEKANAEDPPILIANAAKAQILLSWQPTYSTLENILSSAWSWHQFWEHDA
ncbi:MAG TPA: UDP-glucose 4-epimerase GalE [Rhabdochlamydiaceae bacterium]|nr:UDP-glucose 4-epimerase GalE [Rhabdochlamydiaceae bacterium]